MLNHQSATYETPYGHIVRATNGDEDPGQRWIDLSGKRNGNIYGLTVINDAKYGYSVLEMICGSLLPGLRLMPIIIQKFLI